MWSIGDMKLIVTAVGKSLVHYRTYKLQAKGIPTTLSLKAELQRYLINSKAVLITP